MGFLSTVVGWEGSGGLAAPPGRIPHPLWGPAGRQQHPRLHRQFCRVEGAMTRLLTPGASGKEQKRRGWMGGG